MRRWVDSRLVIGGLVSVLAVTVFALTGRVAWQAYDENIAAKRATHLNSLTDKIILASGIAAVERGLTSAALGAAGPVDASLRRRIDELRGQADTAWREILAASSSAAGLADDPDFSRALDEALRLHKTLLRARKRVDAGLGKGPRDIGRAEWIETTSRFIESTASLREIVVAMIGTSYEIVQLNISVKQRVWLVSEHAGLERGVVAFYVSGRQPIPEVTLSELRSFRSIVEHNLRGIIALKNLPETDSSVVRAIGEMERDFLGRFDMVRTSVYGAVRTGHYGMTTQKWFESATDAINSIHAVMQASSKVIDEKARRAEERSLRALIVYVGIFGATCLQPFRRIVVRRAFSGLYP